MLFYRHEYEPNHENPPGAFTEECSPDCAMGALRHGRRNTWDKGLKAWKAALAFDNIPSWKAEDDAFWAWKPRTWDATEKFETVDTRNPKQPPGMYKTRRK